VQAANGAESSRDGTNPTGAPNDPPTDPATDPATGPATGPATDPATGPRLVGVDVGGTFTDLILLDPTAPGGLRLAKVPTTTDNQAGGVLAALDKVGADLATIDQIVHGTTTTTNALLERKTARTGLITTKGFRDILELGRRTRPTSYGLTGAFEPLIARQDRLEVAERVDAEGAVLTPLDEDGVRAAATALKTAGCEAVVIHFLHSYANQAHEKRAVELVREVWPDADVTAGSAILSEFREYERGTTAAVNAAVQPVLRRYLARLTDALSERGYRRELLVMQGNGGTVAAPLAAEHAVNTVMSGPASGVMAAATVGARSGFPNVITYDMGGTSSDVALIRDGKPSIHAELDLEYGMPIHVPMVDVHTIGAGGGSIARVDEAGLLRVGPESAGAMPGPICYGRGGTEPTVTDANLVLGRLDPDALLAVDAPVTLADIEAIIQAKVGVPLGLSVEDAAAAILRIGNDKMAGAIRMVSLARGHDPRDFALFAFGGAGPLHATALAAELAIPRVVIPARPGITNAIGCVVADLRHDFVNTVNAPLPDLDMDQVHALLAEQEASGRRVIADEAVEIEDVICRRSVDMQFLGQSHILSVEIDSATPSREDLAALFQSAYWARFAVDLPEIRPVLVNLHTAVLGRRKPIPIDAFAGTAARAETVEAAVRSRRRVWFSATGWTETPVLDRDSLPIGGHFEGPAIVSQFDATTVIEPGQRARVDEHGNLIVEVV
jgi:N-methylhydantoinase A